jgi:hypothetical protein
MRTHSSKKLLPWKPSWWAIAHLTMGMLISCAPVKFDRMDDVRLCSSANVCGQAVRDPSTGEIVKVHMPDEIVISGGGKVDILLVNDNSPSMSKDQASLQAKFSQFFSILDRRYVDYQVGMTTTDIQSDSNVPRSINQNGALQNGNLIAYGNGASVLKNSDSDRVSLFLGQIARKETTDCEAWLKSVADQGVSSTSTYALQNYNTYCPSGDERGILAASMALDHNVNTGLFRSGTESAKHIILLTDEDNRSIGVTKDPNNPKASDAIALEDQDLPSTLISKFKSSFGSDVKLMIHVIGVKPGDSACQAEQAAQMQGATGTPATSYIQGATATGGSVNSICASDFSATISNIANSVVANLPPHQLQCSQPTNVSVVSADGSFNVTSKDYTLQANTIHFSTRIPYGTKLKINYDCDPFK